MKHYICQIEETCGEYEFHSIFLTSAAEEDIYKKLLEILKNFRGDGENELEDDRVWFDNILAEIYSWVEVPEEEFQVLRKHISVL